MKIQDYEVKSYMKVMRCIKCEEDMIATKQTLATTPPRYPHQCPKCKAVESADERYPRMYHQRVSEVSV